MAFFPAFFKPQKPNTHKDDVDKGDDKIIYYLNDPKSLKKATSNDLQNASIEFRKAASQNFWGLPTKNITFLAHEMHTVAKENKNYNLFVTAQLLLKTASKKDPQATQALIALQQSYDASFADPIKATISESVFMRKIALEVSYVGKPENVKLPKPG